MNSKYLYLSVDLLAILVPFLSSFYPKMPFYKKWKYLWLSTLLTTIIFIGWDVLFTNLGVWGFNPAYVTGVYFLNIPIEEVLFFICIPYASIFTYDVLQYLIKKDHLIKYHKTISIVLITVLLSIGLFFFNRLYTSVTFIALALFLTYITLVLKPTYMSRFYFSYLIILIPFFIVNGILTGSFIEGEVVWYNNAENLGIRLGTIPFEDVFYGMLMLLINIAFFEWLKRRELATANKV